MYMKRKMKGFTLIELIIVVAIIGIMTAVGVPNLINSLQRSKINSANSQARSIYKAAQTVLTQYEARKLNEFAGYGMMYSLQLENELIEAGLEPENVIPVARKGTEKAKELNECGVRSVFGYFRGADGGTGTYPNANAEFRGRLAEYFNEIDHLSWKMYIYDYQVKMIVLAVNGHDIYVGQYPSPPDVSDIREWQSNLVGTTENVFYSNESLVNSSGIAADGGGGGDDDTPAKPVSVNDYYDDAVAVFDEDGKPISDPNGNQKMESRYPLPNTGSGNEDAGGAGNEDGDVVNDFGGPDPDVPDPGNAPG
jgi:prepilin-type N-terminal cleavage/methylation domain-containing protein